MLNRFRRDHRHPLEYALLLALVLFLPLREAPKNILCLAYLVAWVVNRVRERNIGPPGDVWDALFAAMLASGYLAAAFPGIARGNGNEWFAVTDLLRNLLIAWCVRRAGYTRGESVGVLVWLAAGCALATLEGVWNFKVSGLRDALQLVSVGHVNHSAIYMAICAGISAGLLLAGWRSDAPASKAVHAYATVVLLTGLFLGGSRAAAAAGVVLLVVFGAMASRRAHLGRAVWALLLPALLVAVLLGGTGAVQRQVEYASRSYWLAHRDLIWNRGIVAWRHAPLFGVGMDNYSQITDGRLKAWLAEQGRPYDPGAYSPAPHAHSLYVNTLVERGTFGLLALLALLGSWAGALVRRLREDSNDDAGHALWCASLSGLFVTASIGLVNTTLHHEHGMLALLSLALWLGAIARRPGAPSAGSGQAALPGSGR